MARPLRIEFSDAVYHVTSRGNGREAIVSDDADRDRWMRTVDRVVGIYRWRVFGFALMDNHYHLLLQTPEPNLSKGMQELNGGYAAYFNTRHGRPGHLFQGRFKAVLVEAEGHWDELSRYIHLNPVRAGLAKKPERWAWSSYRGYYRPAWRVRWVDYRRVLTEFGGDHAGGRQKYRTFIAAGLGRKLDTPLSSAIHGLVLGSDRFVDKIQSLISKRSPGPELPQLNRLQKQPTTGQVAQAVGEYFKVNLSEWKPGKRSNDLPRALAAYIARQVTRETLPTIAKTLGYTHASSVSAACRRAEHAMKTPDRIKDIETIIKKIS